MNAESFRLLVSGERRDFTSMATRGLLHLCEVPYFFATFLRNFCYDKGIIASESFSKPIISVGNVTLGGTGKSPLIAWLVRHFLANQNRPGLISRGYKKNDSGVNDEFLELAFHFPEVPHLLNRNRCEAARELIYRVASESVDVILLDDAFQHRKIARDLDIVLIDAMNPFGFGHLFPRGMLRESLKCLNRADIILLSRADCVSEKERMFLRDKICTQFPCQIWGEVCHSPAFLVDIKSREHFPIQSLQDKKIAAFCGIGNPGAFQKTLANALQESGAEIVEMSIFPDHHLFSESEIVRIVDSAQKLGATQILCTMKDFVKLDPLWFGDISTAAISISLQFLAGEEEFVRQIDQTIINGKKN
ncbi:MAG: tetraacyldisaccharide 4'-kinase [Thermoguttaceae bacterium]